MRTVWPQCMCMCLIYQYPNSFNTMIMLRLEDNGIYFKQTSFYRLHLFDMVKQNIRTKLAVF
jgi:hypothetical protein